MLELSKFRLPSVACVVVGWLLLVTSVVAEPWEALFADARVIFQSDEKTTSYSLALGPLKKVNNQWQAERERRLEGRLQRRTLEIPERSSVEEVYKQLRAGLLRHNARPLYTCSGLDCGSSNTWANNYFNVKQLYGLDQNQYYGAWEWQTQEGELYYLSTYVVQRGNKRIYVQIDQLEVPMAERGAIVSSPVALVESLQQQGYFILAGVQWQADGVSLDKEHLKAVVTALQRDPWLKIRAVGHDYGPGSLEQQRERSRAAARQAMEGLVEMGIKEDRVSAHGVGSLAPAGRRADGRIEIVLQ